MTMWHHAALGEGRDAILGIARRAEKDGLVTGGQDHSRPTDWRAAKHVTVSLDS